MITIIKTPAGGPYVLQYAGNLVIPCSLRGPHTNTEWYGESFEIVQAKLLHKYGKIEYKEFTNWQEGIKWALENPYLKDKQESDYCTCDPEDQRTTWGGIPSSECITCNKEIMP